MQCLSCSCLALCLESWSQGEGTEGLFLGLSSSCSTRGGAIYSKVSSSHQIQRFPPCSSLCEMVTGVASGQIVYMHALVGGPCKQELDSFFGSPVPPSKPLKAASADFPLASFDPLRLGLSPDTLLFLFPFSNTAYCRFGVYDLFQWIFINKFEIQTQRESSL